MTGQSLKQTRASFFSWPVLFWLASAEGFAAIGWIASLPSDADSGRFLGFSASRLLLMALMLALSAGLAALALIMRRRKYPSNGILKALLVLLPFIALFSGLAPSVLLMLYRTSGEFHYFAYYQRLLPLFLWISLVSLQALAWTAFKGQFQWHALREQQPIFRAALLTLALIALLALVIIITGIGRNPDITGWGGPTVSLMEWQVWLSWGLASAFMLLLTRIAWHTRHDRLLALAIWLLAAVIWLMQPIRPAFFATAGRAPNFEIYPFSDGAYYDHFAQSALIGNGFKGGEVPARPFYITLLVGFHLIAGQEYQNIIAVQTLLLAFFPVVLFFLGRELHNRPAGLMAALLAVLREVVAAYAMPFTNNSSNSKLLFADLPTALAVSLWALLVIRWIKSCGREDARGWWVQALVAGGVLGLAMLFRTQSVFMLPLVLLLGLLAWRPRWRAWLRSSAVMLLGLALVLAPWLARNTALTGRLVFDDDKSQTGVMAQRYSLTGMDETFIFRPGDDLQAFSRRSIESIFDFVFTHPGVVAQFVTGHFLNAEIDNILVLPIRYQLPDLRSLVMPSTAFWEEWNGSLPSGQAAILFANLALLALGIGACWARAGWSGLALLAINLSYHFSNALARNSGGRYLLVVDWVLYFYAAVGFLEITLALLAVLGVSTARRSALVTIALDRRDEQVVRTSKAGQWRRPVWIIPALLILGALPLLAEKLIPPRYAQQSQQELTAEIIGHPGAGQSKLDRAAVERLSSQPGVIAVKGRVLFPRYYDAGDGELRTAKTGYEPLDYARTVMLLTSNHYNGLVILKAQGAPRFLPNAADVVVLACPAANYLDARLLVVENQPGAVYQADQDLSVPCVP